MIRELDTYQIVMNVQKQPNIWLKFGNFQVKFFASKSPEISTENLQISFAIEMLL